MTRISQIKETIDFSIPENSDAGSAMTFIHGTVNGRPCRVEAEIESLSPIIATEYGHSVLARFTETEDSEGFESIQEMIQELLPEGITFAPLVKDDKFFLKLKEANDKYKCKIDPPCTPNAIEKSPIHANSLINATFQPNLWINYEKKTAGIFLNIYELIVDGGKKKTIRKR